MPANSWGIKQEVVFGIRGCVFDKDNVICENGISSLRAAEAFEQLDAGKIPLKEEYRDPKIAVPYTTTFASSSIM